MKRTLAVVTCIILTIAILISNIDARTVKSKPQSGNFVRISYAENGRYLDIPEYRKQVELMDYQYGDQNQIFKLSDTGKGWKIISNYDNKVLQVSGGSNDDYAMIVKGDSTGKSYERWDIISNNDGTVSFRNKASGLYMNVYGGGDAENETPIIQYHDDGTVAMRFYLEVMSYNDVLSATFKRNIKNSDLKWTQYPMNNPYNGVYFNGTSWSRTYNNKYYFPSTGQSILANVEYQSPYTVANLMKDGYCDKQVLSEIGSAIKGEGAETLTGIAIKGLLKAVGISIKEVPLLGYCVGTLLALLETQEIEGKNKYAEAVKIDSQGRCSGVIVYTYYDFYDFTMFKPLNGGTTAWGTTHTVRVSLRNEYKTWTGDNFNSVRTLPVSDGEWTYNFK